MFWNKDNRSNYLFSFLTDDQNDGDRGDYLHSVLAAIQRTDGE
jgi:hypothetical protein